MKKNASLIFVEDYFNQVNSVINKLDFREIIDVLNALVKLKKRGGRLFLLGLGGSAGNCSHAVNDFRKICDIEAYTPTDNVSELTARINDESWDSVFKNWLKGSRLTKKDAVMIFSVGGGDLKNKTSINLVLALKYAKKIGSITLGVVSRDGGQTRKIADASILIPVISKNTITPLAESFQAVIWHAFVNYPPLMDKKSF